MAAGFSNPQSQISGVIPPCRTKGRLRPCGGKGGEHSEPDEGIVTHSSGAGCPMFEVRRGGHAPPAPPTYDLLLPHHKFHNPAPLLFALLNLLGV
jgi:hypothetical protein